MRWLGACALLVLACMPGRGAAQDKAVAAQLFEAAGELMAAGKYADACPKYAESQRLDPQLGTLLHLAECLDAQGKTASAWANFKDAVDLAAARGDLREPKIRARLAAIEPRVPRLTIRVSATAPLDLEIKRNGSLVGRPAWGLPLPVDPGEHVIVAGAAGRASWSQSLQLTAAARVTVDVPELAAADSSAAPAPPAPVASAPAEAPAPVVSAAAEAPASAGSSPAVPVAGLSQAGAYSDTTDTASRGRAQRIAGWAVLALGVVGVGVGAVFEIQSFVKLGDRNAICPSGKNCEPGDQGKIDRLTDDANSARLIGTIGLIAGGVLAAGGLALVLTAPSGRESGARVSLMPVLAPDQQGLRLVGQL